MLGGSGKQPRLRVLCGVASDADKVVGQVKLYLKGDPEAVG
jgi:hypothetical protein